jgi:hypothetical protein
MRGLTPSNVAKTLRARVPDNGGVGSRLSGGRPSAHYLGYLLRTSDAARVSICRIATAQHPRRGTVYDGDHPGLRRAAGHDARDVSVVASFLFEREFVRDLSMLEASRGVPRESENSGLSDAVAIGWICRSVRKTRRHLRSWSTSSPSGTGCRRGRGSRQACDDPGRALHPCALFQAGAA